MKKRALCMFLAVLMLLGALPMAYAESGPEADTEMSAPSEEPPRRKSLS